MYSEKEDKKITHRHEIEISDYFIMAQHPSCILWMFCFLACFVSKLWDSAKPYCFKWLNRCKRLLLLIVLLFLSANKAVFLVIVTRLFATWTADGPRDELDKAIEHKRYTNHCHWVFNGRSAETLKRQNNIGLIIYVFFLFSSTQDIHLIYLQITFVGHKHTQRS